MWLKATFLPADMLRAITVTSDYSGFATAASIFHSGAALGYIVIALLAFLLGVCVTVLCFRLRQMNREDGQGRESEDAHGAD